MAQSASNKKKPKKTTPPPAPDPSTLVPMSKTGAMVYTIGFSLAVVAFVIGVYQTMVERDLASNYWLFMIALGFLFGLRWWRMRQTGK